MERYLYIQCFDHNAQDQKSHRVFKEKTYERQKKDENGIN